MRFKQLFYMIAKALIVFCEINFVFLNSCHIIDSYVIFDRIIVLYICLTLLNVIFHVNTINFVNVNVWFVILFCNFLTCDFYFNFVFICNFKIQMFVFEINFIFFKLIVICMLNFFELLFRWINLYFVEKKIASWRRNYVVKTSCNFSKILQFFSVLMLYVSTFTLSTNSMTVVFLFDCSHTSSRFALKNKYNINETENSCEISAFILLIVLVFSSKTIEDRRFFRKLFIHWIIQFEIFFF